MALLPQRPSALTLARKHQHRGATLLMVVLCKILPAPLAQPWGCTTDRALFVLVSSSYQESDNHKNTVICNLFSSLVLLRRASVSQTVLATCSVEGNGLTRDRNKAVENGCVLHVDTAHLGIQEAPTKENVGNSKV